MTIKEFISTLCEVNPLLYGDITLDLIINKYNLILESQGNHRLLWLEDNDGRQYVIAAYEDADKNSFSLWCDQEIDIDYVNYIPFDPNIHCL
jgi:hypothetical protein